MQTEDHKLADFLPSPLSTVQKQELLERVLDRQAQGATPRPMLWAATASVAIAAAALLWFALPQMRGAMPTIAAEAESSSWYATGDERLAVMLPAGRRIELQKWTQLNVLDVEGNRARLERGTVRCEGGEKRLTIEAAKAEIYCEGEPLTAEMGLDQNGPYLTVRALGGAVALQHEGTPQTVAPGQSWSTRKDEPPVLEPSELDEATAAPKPLKTKRATQPAVSQHSAEEIWRKAQDARLAGDAPKAARLFSELKTEFPNDSRAGLAAFELGRIQLDRLGKPSAALRAFDFAIQKGKGGFFLEDAAAGRVTALDRMGDGPACNRAREAFLNQHSRSAHAARVRDLCN